MVCGLGETGYPAALAGGFVPLGAVRVFWAYDGYVAVGAIGGAEGMIFERPVSELTCRSIGWNFIQVYRTQPKRDCRN